MQNEQTPAAGPLTAESVKLLQPGDWLRSQNGTVGTFLLSGRGKIAIETRSGALGALTITEAYDPASWSFLGRPDQSGWIAWHGGENPVPGVMVDVRWNAAEDNSSDAETETDASEKFPWSWNGPGRIIAYRPHVASSSSVVQGDASGVEVVRADDAARVHAPDMERSAENQRPKTRDWSELRLCRFDGTNLYQWRGKQNGSIFEDQASEVFALRPQPGGETRDCPHGLHSVGSCSDCSVNRSMDDQSQAPVSRPDGEGEREAVARAKEALNQTCYADVTILRDDLRTLLSLLSPAAPDAGGGDERTQIAVEALERIAAATPGNTNSASASDAFSWTAAVSNTALSALQPGGER